MRSRILIIISVILLVLILAGVGLYLLFSNGDVTTPAENEGNGQVGLTEYGTQALAALEDPKQLPPLTKLNDLPSNYLSYDNKEKQLIYYNNSAEQIFASNLLGYGQSARSDELSNLTDMVWSADRNKGLLFFQASEGSPFRAYIFDNETLETKEIKGYYSSLTWANDSRYLIGYRIGAADDAATGIVKINRETLAEDVLYESDLEGVQVLSYGEDILYYLKTESLRRSSLYLFDTSAKKSTELISGYYNFEPLLSPNENKLIFTGNTDANDKPTLQYKDLSNASSKVFSLNVETFASKCAWNSASTAIYCAVPTSLPISQTLYQDYLDAKLNNLDAIWRISSESFDVEQIIPAQKMYEIDARYMVVGKDDATLYFINRRDAYHIWAVNLHLLEV
ncbi:hypothetical protein ACFL1U_00560 [Patescibacteria group bacterium]